jgi:hypothetical protein
MLRNVKATVYLDEKVWERTRMRALRERVSASNLIEESLRKFLDNGSEQKPE